MFKIFTEKTSKELNASVFSLWGLTSGMWIAKKLPTLIGQVVCHAINPQAFSAYVRYYAHTYIGIYLYQY